MAASHGKLNKRAREYAEKNRITFELAVAMVKHLKRGDRVRVTIPGVARWEGEVVEDQTKATVYITVRRYSDGAITQHNRDKIEFLERTYHRAHPKGWKEVKP